MSREQYPTSYLNKVFSIGMDSESPVGLQLMSYLTSDTYMYGQNTTIYMVFRENQRQNLCRNKPPFISLCNIFK